MLGTSPDHVVVVPNGVEHSDASGAGEGIDVGDAPFVLMVGPTAAHKNIAPVAVLSPTTESVSSSSAERAPRGSSAPRTRPRQPGDPAGSGRIRRVGRVSDATITWLYQHAAVLVFPSLYEKLRATGGRGQRLGRPVVASDRASLPEITGGSALLVDPTDPDQVAQQVAELLAGPLVVGGAGRPGSRQRREVPLGRQRRSAGADGLRATRSGQGFWATMTICGPQGGRRFASSLRPRLTARLGAEPPSRWKWRLVRTTTSSPRDA